MLNAMSPFLLLGFFFAGLLHVYTPKAAFSKYLSRPGFRSVFLSALFGVPLPLCSCGVIPTAMSLKKEGASDGATVSFLIATPQTGVDSILATYGVLGLPFAIVRPIVALLVGLFGGSLTDFMTKDKEAKQECAQDCKQESSRRLTFIDALKYGFVDMLQDLGKWLSIGLIVAAAITVAVPDSIFELFSEYYILNILVVLLLSIPMYICSTGSIPIAVSLLIKGISPGAALVFLMAGPATNVATLAVLRKVLGVKTTIIYLMSIIIGAITFAIIIDFLLPAEWFTSTISKVSCEIQSCGAKWWQTASSILFIALLINAYIMKLIHGGHSHDMPEISTSDATPTAAPATPTTTKAAAPTFNFSMVKTQRFKVEGMRCNHCKANVEKAANAFSTTTSATVDLTSGTLEITGTTPANEIIDAVKQLGFEIEKL